MSNLRFSFGCKVDEVALGYTISRKDDFFLFQSERLSRDNDGQIEGLVQSLELYPRQIHIFLQ